MTVPLLRRASVRADDPLHGKRCGAVDGGQTTGARYRIVRRDLHRQREQSVRAAQCAVYMNAARADRDILRQLRSIGSYICVRGRKVVPDGQPTDASVQNLCNIDSHV